MAGLIGAIFGGGSILGGLFGVGGLVAAKALSGGKKQAQPLPAVTRDDAAAAIDRADELRRRKGGAADMILDGTTGGEAAISPGKLVLGT